MYCHINTGGLRGLESYVAQVEVDISRGLPCFDMVGLLASEIKEARERIRVALRNAQVNVPAEKITVNISPAGIHKAGTAFDLPVALGIMTAQGMIPAQRLENVLVAGELGLNACVKPIRGTLPIVMEAARMGMKECILPLDNIKEGILAGDVEIMGVENLQEASLYLCRDEDGRKEMRARAIERYEQKSEKKDKSVSEETMDFSVIRGMQEAKYAAMTAAAGFHNLLLSGPPGAGKTMLARCIPSILPPLNKEEQRQISAIYSVAGQLPSGELLTQRPFVSPHHTVSPYALAGGGSIPKPGMVTLAHKGVLFLDEMAEFKRSTLDILRQPMEEGKIYLAKSGGNFVYPADFMLVAATNPCPCGYFPDRNRCRCTQSEIHRYLSRISGPMLDRIDLSCVVRPVPFQKLWEEGAVRREYVRETALADMEWNSAAMLDKVMAARERQKFRYAGSRICLNGRLGAGEILRYCRLGLAQQQFLEKAAEKMKCSARACHRILRVARTLADLEEKAEIGCQHISQAIYYRLGEEAFAYE
ncbi:MAG: YifB family Mg chelatase-like AAA ATPase [Lachnospiraceae bacterium]|nr:YifB family Mg chelatase-like AAA ATPase [Lachnospiraceae bacterium]